MNLFGNGGDNCGCSIIWILLLLSCCGNGNNSVFGCGENNSCIWIILLLLLCGGNCDCAQRGSQNCGCGCGC